MHRSPLFYLAVAGIIAAVMLVKRQSSATKVEAAPPVAEPSRSPFPRSVGGRGLVEARGENVRISPPISGLITDVFVDVGAKVTTGAPLLQIDPRTAQAEVAVAEAQIPVLEGKVRETEALLADRKSKYARTRPISDNTVLSQDEGERDRYAVVIAEAAVNRAKAELESGRQALKKARTALEILTVRAPRAGTILQVNVRAGEYASQVSVDPLILLGIIDIFQLRVDIDEENASRIHAGAPALAYLKGVPDYPITLSYDRIEPYIVPKRSLTGNSTERVDTRVLQMIYTFERPEIPVYVGQQMDVFLDGSVGDKEKQTALDHRKAQNEKK